MSKTCIVSGSFDPITLGHIDIIERSLKIFNKVVLAILSSDSKKYLFSLEEREKLAKVATKDLPNVEVVTYNGLMVDLAKELKVNTIVRGMRDGVDFAYENQMATINSLLDPKLDTIFMISRFPHLTSSSVREIIHFGGDISAFVNNATEREIKTILKTR